MNIRRRDIAAVGAATAGLVLAAAAAGPARAQPKPSDSTWELVKKNEQVRMGVFEYPPYFVRNKTSGEWEGAMVDMGRDIASELKVKFVPVEVGGGIRDLKTVERLAGRSGHGDGLIGMVDRQERGVAPVARQFGLDAGSIADQQDCGLAGERDLTRGAHGRDDAVITAHGVERDTDLLGHASTYSVPAGCRTSRQKTVGFARFSAKWPARSRFCRCPS